MRLNGIQKFAFIISSLSILIGFIGWAITFSVDPMTSSYASAWQITWVVNPIGVILSIYLLSKQVKYSLVLLLANLFLIISFGPMWFIGDLINMLSS